MIDCCLEFVCACLLHDINLGPTLPAGGMSAFFRFCFCIAARLASCALAEGAASQKHTPKLPKGPGDLPPPSPLDAQRSTVAQLGESQAFGITAKACAPKRNRCVQKSQNPACANPVHESGRFSCLPKTHGHLSFGGFGNGLLRSNDSLKLCLRRV